MTGAHAAGGNGAEPKSDGGTTSGVAPANQPSPGHQGRPGSCPDDTGSVTPLVIGMALGLVLLSVAIVAIGSVHLGRGSVQHLCDGAAAAAADAGGVTGTEAGVKGAATEYLAGRPIAVTPRVELEINTATGERSVLIGCSAQVPVTFGGLVGRSKTAVQVESAAVIEFHD